MKTAAYLCGLLLSRHCSIWQEITKVPEKMCASIFMVRGVSRGQMTSRR